jgi:hypothetical protein
MGCSPPPKTTALIFSLTNFDKKEIKNKMK